jgi:16S rRNA (cytosine1402-N4)-methyltransferase
MSIKEHPPQYSQHVPVLLDQVIELLDPKRGESYLDLTAGYGGHAEAILDKTKNYIETTLVDRDEYAINCLSSLSSKGVRLIHTDFVSAAKQLIKEGKKFDMIMIDLGVSSPQLDQSERGFSFTIDGPLDMRMDKRQTTSAQTLVNNSSTEDLAHIINQYGEEPIGFAKTVAKAIVENRPINSTGELANLIKQKYRGRWKKIHPATRTFQAIRIAVNDELRLVEDLLPNLPDLLKRGGRVGIISFHSLEDRIVKKYLKEQTESGMEAKLQVINKKPLSGSQYDVNNPRARSSKLRVALKK